MSNTEVVVVEEAKTAVVSWKDKLSGYAKEATKLAESTGGSVGKFVAAKKGKLYYDGQLVAGNKLDVIIVEAVLEHCYYADDFDPDNPQSPVCFAFGKSEDEMQPHEKSSAPQHSGCQGCPLNEFGTAEKGKGKACKNIMRLALLPASNVEAAELSSSQVAYFKLPVTSVKNYANYSRSLSTRFQLPPFAFVTRLGCVDDDKTQFKVTFEDVARLDGDDEIMAVLIERHEEQAEAILFPYQSNAAKAEEEKPAASKKRKY